MPQMSGRDLKREKFASTWGDQIRRDNAIKKVRPICFIYLISHQREDFTIENRFFFWETMAQFDLVPELQCDLSLDCNCCWLCPCTLNRKNNNSKQHGLMSVFCPVVPICVPCSNWWDMQSKHVIQAAMYNSSRKLNGQRQRDLPTSCMLSWLFWKACSPCEPSDCASLHCSIMVTVKLSGGGLISYWPPPPPFKVKLSKFPYFYVTN